MNRLGKILTVNGRSARQSLTIIMSGRPTRRVTRSTAALGRRALVPWSDLSFELVVHLACSLSKSIQMQTVGRMCCTCRSWHQYLRDDAAWRVLVLSRFPRVSALLAAAPSDGQLPPFTEIYKSQVLAERSDVCEPTAWYQYLDELLFSVELYLHGKCVLEWTGPAWEFETESLASGPDDGCLVVVTFRDVWRGTSTEECQRIFSLLQEARSSQSIGSSVQAKIYVSKDFKTARVYDKRGDDSHSASRPTPLVAFEAMDEGQKSSQIWPKNFDCAWLVVDTDHELIASAYDPNDARLRFQANDMSLDGDEQLDEVAAFFHRLVS